MPSTARATHRFVRGGPRHIAAVTPLRLTKLGETTFGALFLIACLAAAAVTAMILAPAPSLGPLG